MRGLIVDEAAAIRLYTGDALYEALNKRLREMAQDKQLQSLQPFLGIARLIQSAMLKLPACGDATVFRGVRVAKLKLDMEYRPGREFEWAQFTSCSMEAKVAEGFTTKIAFVVRCFGGRRLEELSQEPSEHEVTLPIGTRLRVAGVLTKGSVTIILDEVHQSGRTVVEEEAAATTAATKAAVEAAEAAAEAAAATTKVAVAKATAAATEAAEAAAAATTREAASEVAAAATKAATEAAVVATKGAAEAAAAATKVTAAETAAAATKAEAEAAGTKAAAEVARLRQELAAVKKGASEAALRPAVLPREPQARQAAQAPALLPQEPQARQAAQALA